MTVADVRPPATPAVPLTQLRPGPAPAGPGDETPARGAFTAPRGVAMGEVNSDGPIRTPIKGIRPAVSAAGPDRRSVFEPRLPSPYLEAAVVDTQRRAEPAPEAAAPASTAVVWRSRIMAGVAGLSGLAAGIAIGAAVG